jgi:hypothetical protein
LSGNTCRPPPGEESVTGEEFMTIYGDTALRQYVIDEAKRHSKRLEDQEDFVQEAWLRLSQLEPDRTLEHYREEAYRAIHAIYERDRRRKKALVQKPLIEIVHSKSRGYKYRFYVRRKVST